MKKVPKLLAMTVMLLVLIAAPVRGQSALDGFDPNANGRVLAVVVQPDGKILLGGDFTTLTPNGGVSITRNRIARLNADGTLDTAFNPNANSDIYAIAVQQDGKILAGGAFTLIVGQVRSYLARLNSDGTLDTVFNPNANFPVNAIAVQADGKILAGGLFTNIDGQTRNYFARLSNDTAALQNLAVTQTTVTWTRGGSSPQFSRVTFEDSTDNVNYNFLGNGTASGSNWTLTGLNLSIGQNFYIRARGYYRSGDRNGSESIQESVRNAFLTLPPPSPRLNIQRSANTNVVLSWATNFTGFTLEANTNLNTNVWSAPVVSGTSNVVTNAVSGSARFYRLRQ